MTLPDPALSRAVIAGVGNYSPSSRLPQIPAIRNNVNDLASVFKSKSHWGIPAENCRVLSEPDEPSAVATAIAESTAQATDTIIVYLAAHGMITTTGELVIATGNTNPRWPQFTGLRYSWVREALLSSPAKRRVVIIDSCFSGRAISAMSSTVSVIEGQLDIRGAYILASAPPNATAIASPGDRYTAFTGSLIELLRDGLAAGPAFLQLDDIYQLMRKAMIRSGYPQPTQMGTDTVSRLSIVRNAALTQPPASHAENRTSHVTAAVTGTSEGTRKTEAAILLCISLDVQDNRTALDQVDAQIRFIDLLQKSARTAGLEASGAQRRPFSGGEFLLIPESLAGPGHVVSFIKRIRHELIASNSRLGRPARSRLRIAATHIPEYEDGSRILTPEITRKSLSLLRSAPIQQAAVTREISFSLIISAEITDAVPKEFSESEIQPVRVGSDDSKSDGSYIGYYLWAPRD